MRSTRLQEGKRADKRAGAELRGPVLEQAGDAAAVVTTDHGQRHHRSGARVQRPSPNLSSSLAVVSRVSNQPLFAPVAASAARVRARIEEGRGARERGWGEESEDEERRKDDTVSPSPEEDIHDMPLEPPSPLLRITEHLLGSTLALLRPLLPTCTDSCELRVSVNTAASLRLPAVLVLAAPLTAAPPQHDCSSLVGSAQHLLAVVQEGTTSDELFSRPGGSGGDFLREDESRTTMVTRPERPRQQHLQREEEEEIRQQQLLGCYFRLRDIREPAMSRNP
eukprot:768596-Hanusia_phi.AAC.3